MSDLKELESRLFALMQGIEQQGKQHDKEREAYRDEFSSMLAEIGQLTNTLEEDSKKNSEEVRAIADKVKQDIAKETYTAIKAVAPNTAIDLYAEFKALHDDLRVYTTKLEKQQEQSQQATAQAVTVVNEQSAILNKSTTKHKLQQAFLNVFLVLIMFSLSIVAWNMYFPSLDDKMTAKIEIEEMEKRGANWQISTCDGKPCVRVMTKQCGFGDSKDYCIVDLK